MTGRSHECDEETAMTTEEKAELENNITSVIGRQQNNCSAEQQIEFAKLSKQQLDSEQNNERSLAGGHHHVPKDRREHDRGVGSRANVPKILGPI